MDAGQTYRFTATLSGGPGVTAGIGISAAGSSGSVGSLAAVDPDLQRVSDELSHSEPLAFAQGSASFAFD